MKQRNEYTEFCDQFIEDEILSKKEFFECSFINCDFENVQVQNCRFIDCTFDNCRVINPVFRYCSMSGCRFNASILLGINWDGLSDGVFSPFEAMDNCQLKYNNFPGINLAGFAFSSNDIIDSFFSDCNITNGNFSGCCLEKTSFEQCNLNGADFENAQGYIIDIKNCKIKSAVFSFPEAINLLNGFGIILK